MTDGTSNTLLLGETLPEFLRVSTLQRRWSWLGWRELYRAGPNDTAINWKIDRMNPPRAAFGSCVCDASTNPSGDRARCIMKLGGHLGFQIQSHRRRYVCNTDGSVRFISDSIDHRTYQYLGCRHDGQRSTCLTMPVNQQEYVDTFDSG